MGAEKAQIKLDGQRLVDHVIATLPHGAEVVVVSPFPLGLHGVSQVAEDPPFGGPVAGIAAGLGALETDLVGVLAVDAPRSGALLPRLVRTLIDEETDVAAVEAEDGYLQPLCAVWHRTALLRALERAGASGVAAKRLFDAPTQVTRVPGDGREQDYDTPEELGALGVVEFGPTHASNQSSKHSP
ncbi:molybdenum cofactor guanylyltransferase [Corynebacterium godavarianum]|uniref:Molybdenum cofactor guanylyltransferase n=2 Tax=Corynebacterium godavarianum TaxID=2054421 RepID=A0ABY3E779_9CORY|nr:molybdenum cofactor guanylyltransferase [Corynebacterium godavarianum]TSJ75681.1 molybdenum cofactor guanylyltransferase [Corynebacterium godavarianum]